MEKYVPKPIDTSYIELPDEITDLIEKIAENVHEVWAKSRMDEGWTWGKERDDKAKRHPCLVAYEDLPETEKEYDRNTSLGTLKMIMNLGFRIENNKL